MPVIVLSLAILAVLAAGALFLFQAGLRSGDRPGDALVNAEGGSVSQPDGRWPVVVATVHNPGPSPVLVGLSVRPARRPPLLAAVTVRVPFRTVAARFRPQAQAVVGVAAPGRLARWQVPAPAAARRCFLIAVIGQADGRLRVIRVPVQPATPRPSAGAAAGLRLGR